LSKGAWESLPLARHRQISGAAVDQNQTGFCTAGEN